MSDQLAEARERVEALLAPSNVRFIETGEPDPRPADLGALGGWRLESPDRSVEADVYVLDDPQAVVEAAAKLLELSGRADDRGLPAVGSNGGLLFVVRSTASDATVEDAYAALGVAGALAGEEE